MHGHATPRLVKAMQWVGCLSTGEAGAAIRDYRYARDGQADPDLMRWGGGEAVWHCGGPRDLIARAIKMRQMARRCYGQVA